MIVLYDRDGRAVGQTDGSYIFDFSGKAIYQLISSHAYCCNTKKHVGYMSGKVFYSNNHRAIVFAIGAEKRPPLLKDRLQPLLERLFPTCSPLKTDTVVSPPDFLAGLFETEKYL